MDNGGQILMPRWIITAKHRADLHCTFTKEAFTSTMMLRAVLDAIDGNYAEIKIQKYRSDRGQKKLRSASNHA